MAHAAPVVARQTLVVVGNGMTSWRLCHELVESGAASELDVIVIGKEPVPAYDRVRLSSLLGGSRVEDLVLADADWYADAGIELLLGETVVAIDRDECVVRTDRGRDIQYDLLVLATGSTPFVPPIDGTDRRGVFVYRTIEDLQAIRSYGRDRKRAVIVGGGLLGLEAAKAVRDLGLGVDIVEAAPGLMMRQLDRAGSSRLREQIEALGVRVHLGLAPTAIDEKGDRLLVRLPGIRSLAADMVIVSAGIRPATDLARRAGLELASSGGIRVDDRLLTSDDRIHAIGECAAHGETTYGLVAPGYQMARILVEQITGREARFRPQVPAAKLKLLGIWVASVGAVEEGELTTALRFEADGVYRKLLVDGGRLVGALAVGPWDSFEHAAQAVQTGALLAPAELRRFRRKGELVGPVASATELLADAIVCSCAQVTRSEIEAATAVCADVTSVCAATAAGTICGSCRPVVAELVALAPLSLAPRLSQRRVRAIARIARPFDFPRSTPPRGLQVDGQPVARRSVMAPFRPVRRTSNAARIALPRPERGRTVLAVVAALTLVAAAAALVLTPLPTSMTALIRPLLTRFPERAVKLWTGYLTLGLVAATLLLSLRKRWRPFAALDVPLWRAIHSVLGVAALATACVHTALHLGTGLNRTLVLDFIAAVVVGALAATTYAIGWRGRDRLRTLHVAVLWPLPVLVGLHILAAYFYG